MRKVWGRSWPNDCRVSSYSVHTCSKRQMLTGLPGPRSPMEIADNGKKELKDGYTGAHECLWVSVDICIEIGLIIIYMESSIITWTSIALVKHLSHRVTRKLLEKLLRWCISCVRLPITFNTLFIFCESKYLRTVRVYHVLQVIFLMC